MLPAAHIRAVLREIITEDLQVAGHSDTVIHQADIGAGIAVCRNLGFSLQGDARGAFQSILSEAACIQQQSISVDLSILATASAQMTCLNSVAEALFRILRSGSGCMGCITKLNRSNLDRPQQTCSLRSQVRMPTNALGLLQGGQPLAGMRVGPACLGRPHVSGRTLGTNKRDTVPNIEKSGEGTGKRPIAEHSQKLVSMELLNTGGNGFV